MKRFVVTFLLVGIMITATSCGRVSDTENPKNNIEEGSENDNGDLDIEEGDKASGKTSYENVNEFLNAIDSYAAVADVTYISNKNENTYKTLQYSKKSGEYRVEIIDPDKVSGNITMFDGSTIYQYNAKLSENISISTTETSERSEIFLTSFLKNYSNSNEVSVSVGNFDEGECTILEAIVPGNHPYMANEKLWVDNTTMMPKKLVVYDYNESERIIVEFQEFSLNPELKDEIFTVAIN